MPKDPYPGVRLWEISSMVKRETAQTYSYGPKIHAKCKRMWRCINS